MLNQHWRVQVLVQVEAHVQEDPLQYGQVQVPFLEVLGMKVGVEEADVVRVFGVFGGGS